MMPKEKKAKRNVGNVLKNFCCKAREKEVKMEKKYIKRFLTLCESV